MKRHENLGYGNIRKNTFDSVVLRLFNQIYNNLKIVNNQFYTSIKIFFLFFSAKICKMSIVKHKVMLKNFHLT